MITKIYFILLMRFSITYTPSYRVQICTDSWMRASGWGHVHPASEYQVSCFGAHPTLGHVQPWPAAQGFQFSPSGCRYQDTRQKSSTLCLTSFLFPFFSSFLSHVLRSVLAVDGRDNNCGLQMQSWAGPKNMTPGSYLIAKEYLCWSFPVPFGKRAQ